MEYTTLADSRPATDATYVKKSIVYNAVKRLFDFVSSLLVGIVLLIAGSSGLASVSVLSLKGTQLFGVPIAHWMEELSQEYPAFYDLLSTPWVMVLAALAFILPFVGLLYGGIQLIFGFKSPSWKPGLVIFVLWLIIIVVLLVLLIAAGAAEDYVHFVM